ncbi:MAG: hypothetical protein V4667_08745 [Bacteroidota bacterium]
MKKLFGFLILGLLFSCNSNKEFDESIVNCDTVKIHDTIYIDKSIKKDWQKGFGLTHNLDKDSIWYNPVSYYISDSNCSGLAIDFYYGYLRPSDNGTTIELLKLATTNNKKLRPFYRWCLNKTLIISDGALAEVVGVPARQYVEKFPDDFFEYIDIEATNEKYKMWTQAIVYSGYFDYNDYDNYNLNRKRLEEKMTKNLQIKSAENLKRVKQFAIDCTSF